MESSKMNSFAIPLAIIVAGGLIAGAVYLSGQNGSSNKVASNANVAGAVPPASKVNVKPPTDADHVIGDLSKAKVVMIEYSDLECPFCKNFQTTLHQAVTEYGDKVAWVYRHFDVHSNAPYEAQAAECAADVGGKDKFFPFIDKIFSISKSDNNLNPTLLTKTAVDLGIDKAKFQTCLDSGKFKALVDQQSLDAQAAGGEGTPYTVLVTKDDVYPITQGAIPYNVLKSTIDTLLAK